MKYGGLGGTMWAEFIEICSEYELGSPKAAQLKAALETGQLLSMMQPNEKYQFYFACPLTVFNVLVQLVSWLYRPLITVKVCCQETIPMRED